MLDSNICIYVLQGGSDAVRGRIEAHEPGELVVSAVAFAEVIRGVRAGDEAIADAFFGVVAVVPFGREAAQLYAAMPFRRGTFDRLIAAHAITLGLTFVTNNEREFADVPGLRVENWTRP